MRTNVRFVEIARDHDESGSNRSRVTKVIDFEGPERDASGKPALHSPFPRPALELLADQVASERSSTL
jgi:hypothetical protein